MVPGAAVVTGPGLAIALAARIGSAGQNHRPLIRIQLLQALESGARVLHAVDVMDLGMRRHAFSESRFVNTVNDIQRHRPRWRVEYRRLVHVIPKPGNALLIKILIQSAEPGARLLLSKVREDAWTRPDITYIHGAIRVLDETIGGDSVVVGQVFLVGSGRDMQICDGYQMEVFGFELSHHPGEIRELCAVDGEGEILVLNLDVEVDGIGRYFVSPQTVGNLKHSRLRIISVTGLLEAEGPEGGQRRFACKPRVGFNDLPGGGPVNKVVIQGSIDGAEVVDARLHLAEVKAASPGVVEQHTRGTTCAEGHKEGNEIGRAS